MRISDDVGGRIGAYVEQFSQVKQTGERVVIDGACLSACTLVLGIVPRNRNSRRVMEVLAVREEGVAQRFLEINGTWEDHVRYGLTVEEWRDRRAGYVNAWLGRQA